MARAKVMIVEDEIITAAALRKDLQNLGYSICSLATSGEKAIKTAEQEQKDAFNDEKLFNEMDGQIEWPIRIPGDDLETQERADRVIAEWVR